MTLNAEKFCPNCGATLDSDAGYCTGCGARVASATAHPKTITPAGVLGFRRLAFVATVGFSFVMGLAVFFLVHAYLDYHSNFNITFENATDTPLCLGSPPCPQGSGDIRPRGRSRWALDSCFGQDVVTVYTTEGRLIYSGLASCDDWSGARVLINKRDNEFVVADSINARPTPAR